MRLLIDIGNSRIKAGVTQPGGITGLPPYAWREGNFEAGCQQLFTTLARPSRVIVANVAGPGIAARLEEYVATRWQITPEFAHVQANFAGLRTRYEQPSQLGIDRWLAALAGFKVARGAAGVIDAGTAFTVDVVTAAGEHLGGMIAPGAGLMARSLTQGTAQLRSDTVQSVERFATNTQAAISLGCREAIAGMLLRVAARWQNEIGATPQWFVTGGEAGLVSELSPFPLCEVPDLVLQGLEIFAERPR